MSTTQNTPSETPTQPTAATQETLPAVRPEQPLGVERSKHPMTPELQRFEYIQRLGGLLARSGYFSDARDVAQASVKVLAGLELGIGSTLAAMAGIHIIKGQVAIGANLIASQVRRHGYDYRVVKLDDSGCLLEFLSKPGHDGKRGTLGTSAFTSDDARRAGLAGKDNWKNWPRNMYFARAMSNGARWYTPEVFGGAPVYTPEELGVETNERGDIITVEATVTTPEEALRQAAEAKARLESQAAASEETPIITPARQKPLDELIDPAVASRLYAACLKRDSSKTREWIDAKANEALATGHPLREVVARVFELAGMDPEPSVSKARQQATEAAERAAELARAKLAAKSNGGGNGAPKRGPAPAPPAPESKPTATPAEKPAAPKDEDALLREQYERDQAAAAAPIENEDAEPPESDPIPPNAPGKKGLFDY